MKPYTTKETVRPRMRLWPAGLSCYSRKVEELVANSLAQLQIPSPSFLRSFVSCKMMEQSAAIAVTRFGAVNSDQWLYLKRQQDLREPEGSIQRHQQTRNQW
ncbi:hypothetical protein Droror1_Dr00006369 [Drosera rotundifolia]